MAQNTRNDDKQVPRDQQVQREIRQEVSEEIRSSGSQPRIRQPNRDQARGDWDRSGDHQDIDATRAPEEDDAAFDDRS